MKESELFSAACWWCAFSQSGNAVGVCHGSDGYITRALLHFSSRLLGGRWSKRASGLPAAADGPCLAHRKPVLDVQRTELFRIRPWPPSHSIPFNAHQPLPVAFNLYCGSPAHCTCAILESSS